MGIGAFQVKKFVENSGGEVRVSSSPGKGSRFDIWFPIESRDALPEEGSLEAIGDI